VPAAPNWTRAGPNPGSIWPCWRAPCTPSCRTATWTNGLAHFQLAAGQRHRASSDAWASAELLQCLWPAWMREGATLRPWAQAQQWLAARRWVGSG
jgi:hypothetical protein